MITKTLTCGYCGVEFQRTDYPSKFKYMEDNYKDAYCNKYCAMVGAREKYRPLQGTILSSQGYLVTRVRDHPNKNINSQVPYAHLVMEKHLGRYLNTNEMVHHKDGDKTNNDLPNLELMTIGEHVSLHNSLKERDTNGRFIKSLS